MERRTMWAAISVAASLGAGGVHADEEGFYAGLALGKFKQSMQSGDWVVYDAGSGSLVPGVRIDSDNGDLGGALSLGYRLNRYFAAELSFLNAGTADQTNRFG
ncbi:MAG TPA: hypothetical protein VFS24_10695, partial [Steroidobacteraceae bacterium]|nr:hypothetical protein [Steroidobacteraceae bacterium]